MCSIKEKEILVTGVGVVCSLATTFDEFSTNLKNNKSGIGPVTLFDTSGYYCNHMGQIKALDIKNNNMDRATNLALLSAGQSIKDAGEDFVLDEKNVVGVVLGTTCGGVTSHEEIVKNQKLGIAIQPGKYNEVPFHCMSSTIARKYGLLGPTSTVTIACASGTNAIGYAADLIQSGQADIMLAGGSDTVSNFTYSGFSSLRAMTRSVCRPFDKNRDGLVLGEGAAVVVLEEKQSAKKRGANIYAEVKGYGFHNDAYHSTAPHPEGIGMVRSINTALKNSGLSSEHIDYINAHGTGTRANDSMECKAYCNVFGHKAGGKPISSTKSIIGHTLGAAGAIEMVACIAALRNQFIPPTLNFESYDSQCDIDMVPNESRAMRVKTILCCNAGFAGNNAAICISELN